jgi:hypothetical protein
MSAASGALDSGVDRMVSVNTSPALDSLCEWNVDTPDFTFHGYAVGREGVLRQSLYRNARDGHLYFLPRRVTTGRSWCVLLATTEQHVVM